jgi:hypothetical protein
MKFERLERHMISFVGKDGPPFTNEEIALMSGELSEFVEDLLSAVFESRPLLNRLAQYFEGIITLVLKFLHKKEDVPTPLLVALARVFDGDSKARRFFVTFGVSHDEPFKDGKFAQRGVSWFSFLMSS